MLRYLLDTNIVSELMRTAPDALLYERYQAEERASARRESLQSESMAIASIVWHELAYGVERLPPGQRRTALERYLDEVVRRTLPILPFDEAAAFWFARERARLTSLGQTPPFTDGMIAAIAATRDLILVTRNTSDFEHFDGLHVENWFEG